MELHPILEKGVEPNHGLWYVVSAFGEHPTMRVGHSCSFVKSPTGDGKVYVIGGANPDGPFAETYELDLSTFSWDSCDSTGFKARYEHAVFTPESQPGKIYVFGGASESQNMNDVCVYDTGNKSWTSVQVSGNAPSPRTQHTSGVCVGDQFIVYTGGQQMADPVIDRQVHSFDSKTNTWSSLNIKGDSPKPRLGHVMVAIGNKVYVHGGMAGTTFYSDLHVLDLDKKSWTNVKQKKNYPVARTAHGAVAMGTNLYVFGGMSRDGALDDLYRLDTVSMKWTQIELQGPPPASRLDFAMCGISLHIPSGSSAESEPSDRVAAVGEKAKEELNNQLQALSVSGKDATEKKDDQEASGEPAATAISIPSSESQSVAGGAEGGTAEDGEAGSSSKCVDMLFIHGGTDTQGEIFDDCLVFLV